MSVGRAPYPPEQNYRANTGSTQGKHMEHTGNTQGKHREHTGKTHGAHREYAMNTGHKNTKRFFF